MKLHIKKCPICKKNIEWEHGDKPETCPHCLSIMWDKPADECILFNLQERYLKSRDNKVLGQMYTVMIPYARRIILKQLKHHLDEERLEERVEDSVTTIIRYYLTKPEYKILYSFGAMLFGPTQQELFKKKQQDIDMLEMSYDCPLDDGESTLKDTLSETLLHKEDFSSQLNDVEKTALIAKVIRFLTMTFTIIVKQYTYEKAMYTMLLLHHFFNKKDLHFFDDFYNHYGTDLKDIFEKTKLSLMEFLESSERNEV
jgi:hypothetical protein